MISFLPPARPSTPVAVCLNVLPGAARQSIQAFSWLGIPKLYIGAPSTTMSAARNSSSTTLVSANSACVDASTLALPCTVPVSISTLSPASAPASYSAFILESPAVRRGQVELQADPLQDRMQRIRGGQRLAKRNGRWA